MENKILWTHVANEAWQARKQRMHFEKVEKDLFDKLKTLSNNEEKSEGGFLFKYNIRKGPIDFYAIEEIKVMDLEPYRKADIICWKLEKE